MRPFVNNPNLINSKPRVSDKLITSSFFFRPVTSVELFSVINSLEAKHATDHVGLSSAILKRINFNIVDVLAELFNRSIINGIFPHALKLATVIPLYKKGDRLLISNYRPISLLPVVSKIFEKIVKTRLIDFLNTFDYFSSCQFGFRTGFGTEDALLNLMNPLYEGLNNSQTVAALFIDICKAFDMVDHKILLRKLSHIGFRGCMLDWFKSYLEGRLQRVSIGGSLSKFVELDAGVPQGSVLGPTLFLIYVNSIFRQKFNGKIVAFADDMAFAYNCSNYSSTVSSINDDLVVLSNWFSVHGLVLSPKTKASSRNSNKADFTTNLGIDDFERFEKL